MPMPATAPVPIVLLAWRRPEYLAKCLNGLAHVAGIGGAVLLPHVEPGCAESRALIEGFAACAVRPTWNAERLGFLANCLAGLEHGFALGDYLLFFEEDVVPAADFLEYHAWARERYRDDPGVGSVAAYHRRESACPRAEHHAVRRRPGFHGWGCGLWRDKLPVPLAGIAAGGSLDTTYDRHYRATGTVEVYPELSRVQNVGLTTTVQTDTAYDAAWYLKNHRLKHWAGQVEPLDAGEFREVA